MYGEDFRLFGYPSDFEHSTRHAPLDADGPGPGEWIEEVIARNEMIVALRSRLVDKIGEVASLHEALESMRSQSGPKPISARAQSFRQTPHLPRRLMGLFRR
jgi:hypothetical protein